MNNTFGNLQFFEYKIVYNSEDSDLDSGITPEIKELLTGVYERVLAKKKKVVAELNDLIEKYPHIPQFKNYLSVYYSLIGNYTKAFEITQTIAKVHPDYLFGKINLANEYLRDSEFERVPEILGESMEIKGLYPERNIFHVDEVLAFNKTAIFYFLEMENIEAAESRLEIMKKLDDESPYTEKADMQVELFNLKNGFKKLGESRKKSRIVKAVSKKIFKPTKVKPVFLNSQIDQLYENSFLIDQNILKEILDLPKESLINDLKKVIEDSIARYKYFKDEVEWKEETHTFVLHALFLLKELEAREAIENVLNLLRQKPKFLEFWFNDLLNEKIWEVIFVLGKNQLETLKNYILEPGNFTYARTEIPVAVSQIAVHFPERKFEVIDWFSEVFKFFVEDKNNNEIIDTDLIGLMVGNVVDMKAVELEPVIKILYEDNLVTLDVPGDLEYVLEDMHDPKYEIDKRKIKNIFSTYDELIKLFGLKKNETRNYSNNDFDIESKEVSEDKSDIFSDLKVGRNDKCPCGSGLKFKKCHGK